MSTNRRNVVKVTMFDSVKIDSMNGFEQSKTYKLHQK